MGEITIGGVKKHLKWATCNVGAENPWDYGDYFAWGETDPMKTDYSWSTYKFELGTDWQGPFWKYVTDSNYGTVDNKTVLDPEDDAAHVNWGGWGDSHFVDGGSFGNYWSSSLLTSIPGGAWFVYFNSGDEVHRNYDYRCYGRSVRPVTK